jgi:phenylacetate-CoA ligase
MKKNLKDIDAFLSSLYTTKSNTWKKIQEKKVVEVFNTAIKEVPAYKDFIAGYDIKPSTIKTYTDFLQVPSVTKKNYLRAFPWNDLCKRKYLVEESLVMTSTSGSTGQPFYFPRVRDIDLQSAVCHKMFLTSTQIPKNTSTLIIDCFGMGVWIGGLLTYQAFKHVGEDGTPLSIITPGISKHEIFQALKNLGPHYNTIILCGYPPFIKDVVDEAENYGVVWKNYHIKIIFAAEAFSETFREYIVNAVGIKDIYRDTMNIYGSADLGTMAQESPVCILLRRLALQNQNLYVKLFGQATRLPTLAQYIPDFITFESENNSIYCTGDNVLPLIRYEIGDSGGVFTYDEVIKICKEEGIDLQTEAKKVGIEDTLTELPFVYVYERSDFSASFYGAIMYPEFIKKGLAHESISDFVTGKFVMYTKNDEKENQFLEINIEMKHHQKSNKKIHAEVLSSVHMSLLTHSAEYKKLSESLGDRVYPKLVFWSYEDETYFKIGGKQKWVKK